MAILTSSQLQHFDDEGYLVVNDVLSYEGHIVPLMREYEGVLSDLAAQLASEGAIRSQYEDLAFCERLIQICEETGRTFSRHFDISLPQSGIRPDTPIHVGPAVFGLLSSQRLLDVVQDIIGPEIYSNPVQHIRMKLPKRAITGEGEIKNSLVSKVPWHQDNGVILPEADEASILTIWLPLNHATTENGCLQVIPRSHRGGLEQHCPTDNGIEIPEKVLPVESARVLPMPPGSVLLMHQRTVHSSLDNITDDSVRLSFDLRYQPIGQPTGRPSFPGFVARSAAHPETVLSDAAAWSQSWYETRARLAEAENPSFNRWRAGEGICA